MRKQEKREEAKRQQFVCGFVFKHSLGSNHNKKAATLLSVLLLGGTAKPFVLRVRFKCEFGTLKVSGLEGFGGSIVYIELDA